MLVKELIDDIKSFHENNLNSKRFIANFSYATFINLI